tara:strand:+ start:3708 stop:6113 length:2406 start_codon:yes stop_codon:yes gene_type:complete
MLRPAGGFDFTLTYGENIQSDTDIGTTNRLNPKFNIKGFGVDVQRDNSLASDAFVSYMSRSGDLRCAWKSNSYAWEALDSMAAGLDSSLTGLEPSGTSDDGPVDMIQGRGGVRYVNGDFSKGTSVTDAGSTKIWFGHIKRKFCNSTFSLDDYYILPSDLIGPTSTTVLNGIHNNNFGSTHVTHTSGQFSLEVDEGLSSVTGEEGYEVNTPAHTGSLTVKDSVFYMTFTYDNNQETLPYKCGPHITSISGNSEYSGFDGNRAIRLKLTWYPWGVSGGDVSDGTQPIEFKEGGPRITHVNIYRNIYSDGDTSSFKMYDFEYVTTFNLERGWKSRDGSWTSWGYEGLDTNGSGIPDNGIFKVITGWFSASFTQTFRMRAGYRPTENSVNARWKTSTRIRNTLYVGNVYMEDEFGVEKHYPDRMLKCLPSKFDIFPQSKRIDVAVDDGESIVHMTNFGGKILQFKEKTLNIINATKDFEFLESSQKNLGIDYRTAVTDLKAGVAFANGQGVWVYNGKEVVSLFKERIDKAKWQEYYYGTYLTNSALVDYIILSYLPKANKILVQRVLKPSPSPSSLIEGLYTWTFDIDTQSWTEQQDFNFIGETYFDQGIPMGNMPSRELAKGFVFKGDIYQVYNTYTADSNDTLSGIGFSAWKDYRRGTSTHSSLSSPVSHYHWESKDFDVGSEAQKKKFRRLQIRYRTTNAAKPDGSGQTEYDNNDAIPNLAVYIGFNGYGFSEKLVVEGTTNTFTFQNVWTDVSFVTDDGSKPIFNSIQIKVQTIGSTIGDSNFPYLEIDGFEVVYTEKRLK